MSRRGADGSRDCAMFYGGGYCALLDVTARSAVCDEEVAQPEAFGPEWTGSAGPSGRKPMFSSVTPLKSSCMPPAIPDPLCCNRLGGSVAHWTTGRQRARSQGRTGHFLQIYPKRCPS